MNNIFGGGMLTGEKIRQEVKKGRITISDYDPDCINPNSYNLKLHPQLLIYKRDAARANITQGIMPKPIQVGVDNTYETAGVEDRVVTRLTKEGKPGTSKRNKKKKQKETQILHESDIGHNNATGSEFIHLESEDGKKYAQIEYAPGHIVEEVATINRLDELEQSVSDNVSSAMVEINHDIDQLRTRTRRSMTDIIEAAANDVEVLNKNDIELEKNINRLGLYPNIESAVLPPLDMHKENETIEFEIPEEGFVLQPGVLYIGRTVERTWTDKYIPMINGRSSGGRLGISIHICAGFGDIGFDGTWTLEITCVEPVRIYPNSEIAQVCFFKPYGKVKDLYRGRYFKQEDATASRFSREKGDNHND